MFGEYKRSRVCECVSVRAYVFVLQTEEENDKKRCKIIAIAMNSLSFYIYIVFVLRIGKWEMLKENFYDKAKFLPCNLMNHSETKNIIENRRSKKRKTLRTRQQIKYKTAYWNGNNKRTQCNDKIKVIFEGFSVV